MHVRQHRSVETHPDDAPVLLDDILRCGSREDVEIDDPADGCVGESGQRLKIDVHGVGVEQELSVDVGLVVSAKLKVDVKKDAHLHHVSSDVFQQGISLRTDRKGLCRELDRHRASKMIVSSRRSLR